MKVNPPLIVANFTTTALNALALGSASMTTGKRIAIIVGSTILLGIVAFLAVANLGAVVLGTPTVTRKSQNVCYAKLNPAILCFECINMYVHTSYVLIREGIK